MENKEKEIEVDLGKVFHMLRKRIIFIILGTLITAVLAGCITEFFISPKYSTSCTLYVYSNSDRVSTDSSIASGEITASQQLVNTYIVVLESDTVMDAVIKELGLNVTSSQLRSLVSCEQINETEIFRVTVTTQNAALSADIANAIADIAPDAIVDTIKAGGVSVIDYAKVPSSPFSPNFVRNVAIGAAVGLAVTFIAFFVYELFDTTITNEKDLEREFEVPVLGSIPRLIPSSPKTESAVTPPVNPPAASDGRKGGKL